MPKGERGTASTPIVPVVPDTRVLTVMLEFATFTVRRTS
jgi:hypothetical protein